MSDNNTITQNNKNTVNAGRPENKMGVVPIPKLLIGMSLPMMASMLVQACYNIVDSMFVARLNEDALTAVSLAMPVQFLMIAVAGGTVVGVNSLLSRNLGEKNYEGANLAARNAIFLAIIGTIVFAVIGGIFSHIFFTTQTDNQAIIDYGTEYLSIVMVFSFGIFMQFTFDRLLMSTGRTFYTMITQLTGAIINLIFDPILIFGYFGFPKLGVAGAAIATVMGQIIGSIVSLILNIRKNHDININMRHFRPHGQTIKTIYIVGFPSIIMQSISSFMMLGMNSILMIFSSTAAAVFGIYFKLQSFIFMPIFGLNNGMIPIIAYNYGAGNKKRIMSTLKLSILIAVGIMLIGLTIMQTCAGFLLTTLFKASDNMLQIGVPALRIISLSFTFAGYCIIVGSLFQALGNGVYTLIISVIRQLVGILPIAYIFASVFGLAYVWWSIPLAEILSLIFSTILFRRIYVQKVKFLKPAF
ncbi:MAG: MATE family efflux transporter [Lachnospiraceae bacterium]|jgi:putative MATE family efflux protein|nr:MATE family efflux transporter [Lachnospiraceae bacterium]